MKNFFAIIFAASALAVSAATSPSYINNSPITTLDRPPQIDANVFVNRSTFDVLTSLPYQALNVQFWTNNAIMNATPGFRFEQDGTGRIVIRRGRAVRIKAPSRRLQLPSSVFYNDGNISSATMLLVNATNIYHSGRFDGLETSKINLLAVNGSADLSRGGIRVGTATGLGVSCGFPSSGTTFIADNAIVDQYWGAGRNDFLGNTNGVPLDLPSLASFGSFRLPNPRSPVHQVLQPFSGSRTFTNSVVVPSFFQACGSNYDAFMHTGFIDSTSSVINIVFAPTRSLLAPDNLFMDVRFTTVSGRAGFSYAPVIEFRSVDFDIVDQQSSTNYFTFIDSSSAQTNITLLRPTVLAGSRTQSIRRPSSYTWIRGRYCSFDFSAPANDLFDSSIFYNPLFRSNTASTIYAADQVAIGAANSQTVTTLPLGVNPALTDPTNFDGTINIVAAQLNLENSRIRAQDFIGIHTTNLVGNAFAQLDAPFVDFDVHSTNSNLVISNISPTTVNRIFGTISAYSSVWNVQVTNAISGVVERVRYHVTVVDNCLQSEQPVTMNRFFVGAPNLVIADRISINAALKIDARNLTIQSGGGLNLPAGANLAFTNVKQLLNFTNDGFINVPASAYFGTFQAGHIVSNKVSALDNFVNHGSINAASIFVRATNAQVIGAAFFPASLVANGGVLGITATNIEINSAAISSSSDTEIRGRNILLEQTTLAVGAPNIRGALVIDAAESLSDGGLASSNQWSVTSGARVSRPPAVLGDLMGTHIFSQANLFAQSLHIWAGEDRGVTPEGFTNNLALARLTLDGAKGTTFRFQGAGADKALYVEYLELLNFPSTNYESTGLSIAPDFTIYFADSNIQAEKLNGIFGGRVRWVSSYAGPRSSTSLLYPNGLTYTFNSALVRSKDLDSDLDGVANLDDCTPVIPPGEELNNALWFGANCPAPDRFNSLSTPGINVGIAHSFGGGEVVLSWNAEANSANTVEFTESLTAGSWQTLTNFINGPVGARVTVKDAVGAPLRIYRVRMDAGKP